VLQAFGQAADILWALEHDAQALEAQRLFGQARLGYSQAKSQRYLDTAQLFEVMGGAWRDWQDPALSSDGAPID
jgi:hypothetical protein